jgi:hypothetical protein
MIWLSITENVWNFPKLKIGNNFKFDDGREFYGAYYKNIIYIPNNEEYIDCFYHEWRHFFQMKKDLFKWTSIDYSLESRFQIAMIKSLKINRKFEKRLFKLYLKKLPIEQDAYSYQFLKCPNGTLTKKHKALLS